MTVVEARPDVPGPLAEQTFDAFLRDIEPFFTGRPVTYVDVGAHRGETFRAIYRSPLRPRRACLVEPNPAAFTRLQETVRSLRAETVATCHPLGLGAAPGEARFRADASMTRVIGDGDPEAEAPGTFSAPISTLDALAADVAGRISLLKIDVEGFELPVLEGGAALLGAGAADMVYIEAGFNPAGGQQTYYREIEDRLAAWGYRLFRIYEQTHEWQEDSPLLRRVNLAFMSGTFADSHPFRLSREVFTRRQAQAALEAALTDRDRDLAAARAEAGALAAAVTAAEARVADREAALAEALAGQRRASASCEKAIREAAARTEAEVRRRGALERELAELTRYGRQLETRHLQLLHSTSWRLLEPLRRMIRLVRGRNAPAEFEPRLGPQRSRNP